MLLRNVRLDLEKHQTYFETLAEAIAIIAENINMQMEAEFADLFDRKLMSLYGIQPGKASKTDMMNLNSKTRTKAFLVGDGSINM
jgi:hypothetical protein